MSVKDLVNGRAKADDMEDGEAFTVGTIAGLDDESPSNTVTQRKPQNRKKNSLEEKKDKNTLPPEGISIDEQKKIITPEMLEGTVSIKIKNEYRKLISLITDTNDEVIVQDFNDYFQVNAKQIRVLRQDAERVLGYKVDDGKWRILWINRTGEVTNFTNYEFSLGVTMDIPEESAKDTSQVNTRILTDTKISMDTTRNLLGMTQAQFLEVAITDYVKKVNAEKI